MQLFKYSNTKIYANPSDDPAYKEKHTHSKPEAKYDPLLYSVHYNTIQEMNEDENDFLPKHVSQTKKAIEKSFERVVKSSQSNIKKHVRINLKKSKDSLSEGNFRNTSLSGRENKPLELKDKTDLESPQPKERGLLSVLKEHFEEGRLSEYKMEEENLICARFPHLEFCGCSVPCSIALKESNFQEVYKNLYVGNLVSAYSTQKLLKAGITHILDISSNEYTKRKKYFHYLTIEIYDVSDEDIKKHFRITNRFITEAIQKNGKVLIHDIGGKSRAPAFAIAYLISIARISLKNSIEIMINVLGEANISINHYFWKQLQQYDLENLANFSIKRRA